MMSQFSPSSCLEMVLKKHNNILNFTVNSLKRGVLVQYDELNYEPHFHADLPMSSAQHVEAEQNALFPGVNPTTDTKRKKKKKFVG